MGLALKEMVLEAGDAPPAVAENASDVGLTVNVGAVMVNCTGMLVVELSPRRMVMVPL